MANETAVGLQPTDDRLLVLPNEEEEQTIAGVIIPATAQERPQRGRVIAVGPGGRTQDGTRVPLEMQEGDEVVYSKFGGTEIKYENIDYLLLREGDVLAIVSD